jgi:hypothetical protein
MAAASGRLADGLGPLRLAASLQNKLLDARLQLIDGSGEQFYYCPAKGRQIVGTMPPAHI